MNFIHTRRAIGYTFVVLSLLLALPLGTPVLGQTEAPSGRPTVENAAPDPAGAPDEAGGKAAANQPSAAQAEDEEFSLEQTLETVLGKVNGAVEAVLFRDIAFGAFKSEKIGRDGQLVVDDEGTPVLKGPTVPFVVAVLVLGSVFFTFWYGWINVRGFKHSINVIRGKYDSPDDKGEISHFRALTSALSATVGLGNIAGVAIAVTVGGPGAVFWMLLLAVFGMTAKFSECTLAQMYRKFNPDGTISGGPMYYLDLGLKQKGPALAVVGKVLAVMFALMCIGATLGGGNMFQANQSFEAFAEAFDVSLIDPGTGASNPWPARGFGIVMAGLVAVVILGGIKRIGGATSRIVPTMCLLYVIASLIIIFSNITQVPSIIGKIFTEAFSAQAGYGGFIGAMILGFKRAAFSNEAGLGSAAIAHAAARTNEPVREGIVAMIGPFIDTIVICLMTALVVLITGAYIDPEPVLGKEPSKIKVAQITAVVHNNQKATVQIDLGRDADVIEEMRFLVQRGKILVDGTLTITSVTATTATGEIKLKEKKQKGKQRTSGEKAFANLPRVGDIALTSKYLAETKPKTLIEGRVALVVEKDSGNIATIDRGSEDGLVREMVFHAYRDHKYLGSLTVIKTDEFTSTARVQSAKSAIGAQDLVLSGRQSDKGAAVTVYAFNKLSSWFPYLLSISIILFAYSTMISWCYYGERAWMYLFGHWSLIVFRVLFVGFVFMGSVMKLGSVLEFSDLLILCMAFPNIVGSLFLIAAVRRKLKDYWSRYKSGEMKTYAEMKAAGGDVEV